MCARVFNCLPRILVLILIRVLLLYLDHHSNVGASAIPFKRNR